MPSSPTRESKNHRRAAARQRAREAMALQRRRERRTTVFIRSGIVASVMAVLAVIALIVVSGIKPPAPGPRNMASDGIVIGKGLDAERGPALAAGATPTPSKTDASAETADIRLYTDYLCPACGAFEKQNRDYIEKLVKSGAATAELHPVAILDRASLGTRYSTRSSAAAACVADQSPDSYFAYNKALFARQPAENSEGLDNATLKAIAHDAKGLTHEKAIDRCIDDQRFASWVTEATKRALAGKLPGIDVAKLETTPTVTVNGKLFDSSEKQTFEQFVAAQLGDAADHTG